MFAKKVTVPDGLLEHGERHRTLLPEVNFGMCALFRIFEGEALTEEMRTAVRALSNNIVEMRREAIRGDVPLMHLTDQLFHVKVGELATTLQQFDDPMSVNSSSDTSLVAQLRQVLEDCMILHQLTPLARKG